MASNGGKLGPTAVEKYAYSLPIEFMGNGVVVASEKCEDEKRKGREKKPQATLNINLVVRKLLTGHDLLVILYIYYIRICTVDTFGTNYFERSNKKIHMPEVKHPVERES